MGGMFHTGLAVLINTVLIVSLNTRGAKEIVSTNVQLTSGNLQETVCIQNRRSTQSWCPDPETGAPGQSYGYTYEDTETRRHRGKN